MTDDGSLESVLDAVRSRVEPTAEERERLEAAAEEVVERARAALADLPVEAEVVRVGSTARDTWLRDDRDIDVFVRFPRDLPREELEAYGLEVGHAVLPDGREEFAEHPYVTGEHRGFRVDLVPCYAVPSAREIESAVDRTPFHAAYVESRLTPELASDVRLLKAFLGGIGVYGSDLRTRGFSGYLAELLVLEFGGFRPLVEAAAGWHPPVVLDPADHGEATFDDPLVVIDPTDPGRNVAAVLSATNLARFQHHARALLAEPSVDRFFPDPPDPLDPAAVEAHLERRGTTPVAVAFPAPDLVPDQLYPQLEKSLEGVGAALDRRGFRVLRQEAFAADRCVLLFELEVARLPAVERHVGPPVHVREHAEAFLDRYGGERDDGFVYGPFVDDDRYVVEREREVTSAPALLESDAVFDARLGTDVEDALRAGYDVLVGADVASLADEFGAALADYFDPSP